MTIRLTHQPYVYMVLFPAILFTLKFEISAQDWPSFLGPNRDGKSKFKAISTDWNNGGLPLLWSIETGEGYAIGSYSNGRYFHFDRIDDNARLVCFDANDGSEVWSFKYPTDYDDMYGFDGGPRSSPVVDENRVYIVGVEGMLYCLNANNGSEIWKSDTKTQFGVIQNFFGVGSTPIIYDDKLIVMVGGSPESSQSAPKGALNRVEPNGSAIVAFDKKTGDVLYKTGDDLASYASPVIRQIDGKDWCFAFCRNNLIGFDPDSGDIRFEFPWKAKKLESVNASCPVIFDNMVFISESYGLGSALLKIQGEEYELIWKDSGRDKSLETHWNTPIEIDGYIYASHGQYRGSAELRCLDAKTGEVKWSEPGLQRASLTYVDDHFICLSENGQLALLKVDSEKFNLVTQFTPSEEQKKQKELLKYPCWAAPIVADGKLFVLGQGRLFCFRLARNE